MEQRSQQVDPTSLFGQDDRSKECYKYVLLQSEQSF